MKKRADQTQYTARLSEQDIVEAIDYFLKKRGDVPNVVGRFCYRFGLVGDPQIILVGDATELPDAGKVYLDWSFEELPNVTVLPKRRSEK